MNTLSISLSSRGLTNISKIENDFEFIVNGVSYLCSTFQAEFISPLIGRIHASDPFTSSFSFKTKSEGDFGAIVSLMFGQPIEMNDENQYFLLECASLLGNDELLAEILDLNETEFSPDEAIERVNRFTFMNYLCEREINQIAMNISNYSTELLKKLSIEAFRLILQSEELQIKSEAWLFNLVKEIYKINGNKYISLFNYIIFENLSGDEIHQFLELISINDFSYEIWNSLCRRLQMDVIPETRNVITVMRSKKINKIPYIENKNMEFDGIIRHFIRLTGGNPAKNKTVQIITHGGDLSVNNLFDYTWDGLFNSADTPDNWVAFDFKKRKVFLTHYTLKSWSGTPGSYHLTNWIVEGSDDFKNWSVIDEHENDQSINGPNYFKTFECQNPGLFRFLRLKQTLPTQNGVEYISLTNIEFFGTIQEAE